MDHTAPCMAIGSAKVCIQTTPCRMNSRSVTPPPKRGKEQARFETPPRAREQGSCRSSTPPRLMANWMPNRKRSPLQMAVDIRFLHSKWQKFWLKTRAQQQLHSLRTFMSRLWFLRFGSGLMQK
mmetsp:Transcript_84157/g.214237  ORF Transcript_84157/g.214237 Transcript_84157/m.214237 type:complete len:124 (-) Transcript_84157:475-846(-)